MHRLHLALLLVLPLAATGCKTGSLSQPSVEFTKAARGFLDVMGPDYLEYVEADEGLTPVQKENRAAVVDDFGFAVRMAEKANDLPEVPR